MTTPGAARLSSSTLSTVVLAAYAAPAFSQALIHGPVNTVIQGVYGKYFGMPLASIALVLVVSRIFDAVTDPLIGYLSDRYHTRWGQRKPWLVAGSLLAVVACWFLYVPAEDITPGYFLLWFLLAYLGWTISEIPYRAWMAELSNDYNERTRIATWRTFARYMGFIAFYGIPFLPMFETSEFTPETLKVTAILATIALPTTAILAAWLVPRGTVLQRREPISLRAAWPAVIHNKPLLLLLLSFAIGGLGTGCVAGLMFFFVDGHLGLGPTLALLFVLGAPVGALMMPLWNALAQRIGKARTWAFAYAITAVFLMLHLLIPVGEAGKPWLIGLFLLVFAASSVGVVMPAALLADIVDYGRWKFKGDYAGSYYSLQTMVEKAVEGLGVAMGLAVLAWFGFDAQASEQTASGTFGLLLGFPILPTILILITVPVIWHFPITARRQQVIMRRLQRTGMTAQ